MSLFSRRYHPIHTNMTITNRVQNTISPLRLHAASSVRILTSTNSFRTLLPTVRIRPLYLFSASSVDLNGASNTNVLRNNLRVRLSPIKSPILRNYLNPFKRPSMHPSISKCNAKSINCCQHLCTNTTITSSVNGRTFSFIKESKLFIIISYHCSWMLCNVAAVKSLPALIYSADYILLLIL